MLRFWILLSNLFFQMVHYSLVNGKRPCSVELKSNLECLAKVIQFLLNGIMFLQLTH